MSGHYISANRAVNFLNLFRWSSSVFVRLASETVSSWRVGHQPPSSAIALWVSGLANPPSTSLKSTLLVRSMRIRTLRHMT